MKKSIILLFLAMAVGCSPNPDTSEKEGVTKAANSNPSSAEENIVDRLQIEGRSEAGNLAFLNIEKARSELRSNQLGDFPDTLENFNTLLLEDSKSFGQESAIVALDLLSMLDFVVIKPRKHNELGAQTAQQTLGAVEFCFQNLESLNVSPEIWKADYHYIKGILLDYSFADRNSVKLEFDKAIEIDKEYGRKPHFKMASAYKYYATAELNVENRNKNFKKSFEILEDVLGMNHSLTNEVRFLLGDSFISFGKFDAALPHLEKAVEVNESLYGRDEHTNIAILSKLAVALRSLENIDEAKRRQEVIYRKIIGFEGELSIYDELDVKFAKRSLVDILKSQGAEDEAKKLQDSIAQ